MRAPAPPFFDLLACFLACEDAAESERLLERLVCEQAEQVVSRIVASRIPPASAEDVRHEIFAGLIARLREMKEGGAETEILDFSAYAAVAAFHGCKEYFRQCYPLRYRLRNRLRYLLTKERRFALWLDAGGEWICGLRQWRPGWSPRKSGEELDSAGELSWSSSREAAAVVAQIFEDSGAAVPFDELVGAVAHRWGITDRPEQSAAEPAAGAQIETALQNRSWLKRLWEEIAELPARQRIALLLNLRDDHGGSALMLLPATGVASLRQIAAALEMEAEALARIWNDLPLADQQIAAQLKLTRQQVINLRKSARERLGRRLA
jgi:hypothetical protein